MARYYSIILAGGRGTRMGGAKAKQFLEIGGKPILRHTVEKFLSLGLDMETIVVLPSDCKEEWRQYCRDSGFIERYIMPSGGITRFHSVRNALEYVPDGAIVAVHDGVRPFVDRDFLLSLFEEASQCDGLIPVIPPVETVREIDGNGMSYTVDRSRYVLVQTPQVFRSEILKRAYSQPYSTSFTDDASVVEYAGYKVRLAQGRRYNIKITTPEDLTIAEAILRSGCKDSL